MDQDWNPSGNLGLIKDDKFNTLAQHLPNSVHLEKFWRRSHLVPVLVFDGLACKATK